MRIQVNLNRKIIYTTVASVFVVSTQETDAIDALTAKCHVKKWKLPRDICIWFHAVTSSLLRERERCTREKKDKISQLKCVCVCWRGERKTLRTNLFTQSMWRSSWGEKSNPLKCVSICFDGRHTRSYAYQRFSLNSSFSFDSIRIRVAKLKSNRKNVQGIWFESFNVHPSLHRKHATTLKMIPSVTWYRLLSFFSSSSSSLSLHRLIVHT